MVIEEIIDYPMHAHTQSIGGIYIASITSIVQLSPLISACCNAARIMHVRDPYTLPRRLLGPPMQWNEDPGSPAGYARGLRGWSRAGAPATVSHDFDP
jgi:hypothetical protein